MKYERTVWKDGDVLTAKKLNNIEQGIEDINTFSSFYVTIVNFNEEILDKTFKEILEAFKKGPVLINHEDVLEIVEKISISTLKNEYEINHAYTCTDINDYPVFDGK